MTGYDALKDAIAADEAARKAAAVGSGNGAPRPMGRVTEIEVRDGYTLGDSRVRVTVEFALGPGQRLGIEVNQPVVILNSTV